MEPEAELGEGEAAEPAAGSSDAVPLAPEAEEAPPPEVDEWLRIAAQLPLGAEGAADRDAIFAKVDVDGDGTMTEDEAQAGLQVYLAVEAALWDKALRPVVLEGFKVCADVPPSETPPSGGQIESAEGEVEPTVAPPAHPGGVSREAFWKLSCYLRRHCELTSALGRAWTVDEYDGSSPIPTEQLESAVGPTIEAWGVAPPDGGFLSLDRDGDGALSLDELSAWACAACVNEVLTEEADTPEEPIEVPPPADARTVGRGSARTVRRAGAGAGAGAGA